MSCFKVVISNNKINTNTKNNNNALFDVVQAVIYGVSLVKNKISFGIKVARFFNYNGLKSLLKSFAINT